MTTGDGCIRAILILQNNTGPPSSTGRRCKKGGRFRNSWRKIIRDGLIKAISIYNGIHITERDDYFKMINDGKRVIERLIGRTDKKEIDYIKMIPLVAYTTEKEKRLKQQILQGTARARIIYDSAKLTEQEKGLFNMILYNNNLDESFIGRLEIYDVI